MNKLLPVIVCGFAAAVLSIIPIIKDLAFCFAVPFAAGFSLYLKQKVENDHSQIKAGSAIGFGIGTGLFAALFYTLFVVVMIFVTRTHELFTNLPEVEAITKELATNFGMMEDQFNVMIDVLRGIESNIRTKGFSAFFTVMTFFSSAFLNTILGLIGGLIGMVIINRKIK